MSVGGRIIEIKPMTLRRDSGAICNVVRFWCVDRNGDETCVYAAPAEILPGLGDEIWWQSGKIYFDHDRQHLNKIGNSFDARAAVD